MQAFIRLVASATIAFVFYAAWAYYANSLKTSDTSLLYKAALVQGIYSAAITLLFTAFIEFFYKLFENKVYCLPFIVPTLFRKRLQDQECHTEQTFKNTLQAVKQQCNGLYIPGVLITPLPALLLQSILVISVNYVFMTPNLWLTVLPSIIFSGIYGYIYSIGLGKKSGV